MLAHRRGFALARWVAVASLVGCTAPLTVDRLDDEPTASTCVEGVPDDCSLRGAILNANRTPGPVTITVPSGTYTLTLSGPGEDLGEVGDLDLTDSADVQGDPQAPPVIQAGFASGDRVLHVDPVGAGIVVNLEHLVVAGGSATASSAAGRGAGIANHGAVLTVVESRITANHARVGGGIYNAGTLVLVGSRIEGNLADRNGGGLANGDGDADVPGGEVVAEQSTFAGNRANGAGSSVAIVGGGGILNAPGGQLTLDRTLVIENQLFGWMASGGGLANQGEASVIASTFLANRVNVGSLAWTFWAFGGGIANEGALAVENSTFSSNLVSNVQIPEQARGGALHNTGTATLRHVTVEANSSGLGALTPIDVGNSLLADPCSEGVTSSGGNLESAGHTCGLDEPSDRSDVADAGLGPLTSYDGVTAAYPLLSGSPAIDMATASLCPAADQRGQARDDGHCDTGAFERRPGDP
ncbi:MAG: hypothetical protein IPK07_28940 [Deltaproteobacteria bacterium]|nr:hypothetical protein [Deltaproteobacteria bacterium]